MPEATLTTVLQISVESTIGDMLGLNISGRISQQIGEVIGTAETKLDRIIKGMQAPALPGGAGPSLGGSTLGALPGARRPRRILNARALTPEGTDAAALAAAQGDRDSMAAGFDAADARSRGNYLAKWAGAKQRFTGKDADQARNQKIKQARKELAAFNREMLRADTLADIDVKIRGLEQTKAFNDALRGVAATIKGQLASAVDEFRAKWEATTGKMFDEATQSQIANGPAAKRLAELQDAADATSRAAEDASNAQSLQDAKRSGDPRAIAAAEAAIVETARQREITQAQAAAERERESIEATRVTERQALLDSETVAFSANLQTQTDALYGQLQARAISYADYAAKVNAILTAAGLAEGFGTNASDESAINAGLGAQWQATPYRPKRPRRGKKGRASGGLIDYNVIYRVGEAGPEDIMVGAGGGRVTPASRSGGIGAGDMASLIANHGTINIGSQRAAKVLADRWAYRARYG